MREERKERGFEKEKKWRKIGGMKDGQKWRERRREKKRRNEK